MTRTRRSVLRGIAAGGGAVVAGGVGVGPVRATPDPFEPQPEAITLSFEPATLERYRPQLIIDDLRVVPTGLYGWVARHDDRDTAMACYWCYYTRQVGLTEYDSHVGDREPIYVEFDPNSEEVVAVTYDAYHYLARTDPNLSLSGTTPRFRVVRPWHFYRTTVLPGDDLSIRDFREQYADWIGAGWEVHRRSVLDPWKVRERGHWWRDRLDATRWRLFLQVSQLTGIGIDGGTKSDLS